MCVHAQKRQRVRGGRGGAAYPQSCSCRAREIAPSPLFSLRNKTISPPRPIYAFEIRAATGYARRAFRARQFIADNSIATWVTTSGYSSRSDSFFSLSLSPVARSCMIPSFLLFPLFQRASSPVSLIALVPRDMHRRYLCRRTLFEHPRTNCSRRLRGTARGGFVTISVKYSSSAAYGH